MVSIQVETEFSGSVVLVASLNPNKPGIPKPAFCLFDGRPSTEERESNAPRPYQVSSGKTYHWDSKESLIVGQLRQFSEEWVGQENMQFRRPISCLVERVEEMGQFGDLVGLVLAVEAGEDGQQPVVWMWDGSDAPPFKLT